MSAQNLLRLLLLLMLRTVLTTVWCRFGSWSLVIQLNFCSQGLVKIFKLKFRQDYEAEDFSLKSGQFFAADVWFRLRSLILVEILKLGLGALLYFRHYPNYLHCGYVNIGAMSSVCSFQNAFSKFGMVYFAYFENKNTTDWYSQKHWKIRKESFSKGKIDVSNTLEKRFLFLGFPIIWTGNTPGSQIADNFPKWVPFTPNP